MFGIYIHIPFCIRRCPFCDFTLVTDAKEKLIDSYVAALCSEIEQSKSETPLTSIYFGGGTPSILPMNDLSKILETVHKTFSIEPDAEVTLETNPEDVTQERVATWKRLGINRVSLGVQSMEDRQLRRLGRNHLVADVEKAFQIFNDAQFENISVDLIFGLENQDLLSWENTLHKLIRLKPKHISTYNLTIEKNTAYDKEYKRKLLELPPDEEQAMMLIRSKEILFEHGFDPYEISNAAIPGFESRHNMLYWTGQSYLGFGVSAHSFQNQNKMYRRFWNTKNIPLYIKNLGTKKNPIDSEETLDAYTHLTERLMTGLRLKNGVDLEKLKEEGLILPPLMGNQIQSLLKDGLLIQTGSIISIPANKIPIANEILLRLF